MLVAERRFVRYSVPDQARSAKELRSIEVGIVLEHAVDRVRQGGYAAPVRPPAMREETMEYKSCFSVIVTPRLAEARDFYVEHLGFAVVFESDWYIQLHAPREGGGKPIELAFMQPNQESQPSPLHPAFNGVGVIFTLQVAEPDALYPTVRDTGCEIVVPLRDEPWGQRHFLIRDPAGNLLDFVKQISPSSEYEASYE